MQMSGPPPSAEWYIARDGQQFGPISGVEFAKLIEGGFLKASDLVWREGLPDWRSAETVLAAAPMQPAPAPRTQPASPSFQRAPAGGPEAPASGGYSGDGLHGDHAQRPMAQVSPTYGGQNPAPGADWRPAEPMQAERPAHGGAGPVAGPVAGKQAKVKKKAAAAQRSDPGFAADGDDEVSTVGRGGGVGRLLKRVAAGLFLGTMLAAAIWYAYPHRERIVRMASAVTSFGGSNSPDRALLDTSPFRGFQTSTEGTDGALQKALLWRTLKREFPEWYANRVKDAASMTREKRSEADVGRDLAAAIVQLRRQHSGDALAATMPRLRAIAAAFSDNLQRLRRHSVDACYGFISSGEAHPVVVGLFQTPDHASHLQKQLNAVFEAVAEGRKTPRVYAAPKQADYNLLVVELEARGWSQADMQLFSDSKALAKAAPEKVCQMVQEWFEAQLAVKDTDAQLRLIVDALRPVVAG